VLILPGLVAHDSSTRMLRSFLNQRGYAAHGWGQGINFGPRPHVIEACVERLRFLHRRSGGRKVSVVGQSLGGVYALLLAGLAPELVRSVIMLGSPISGTASTRNARRLYRAVSGRHAHHPAYSALLKRPPRVPTTSIFSRSDGVVAWQCSLLDEHPLAENIEVYTSHMGMALAPAVLHAIADRLAQPEGQWQPFQRHRLLQWAYGSPQCTDEQAAAALREMTLGIARTEPAVARANGIELTYDTFGDPTAPAMVMIMGLATQMIAWDEEFCAALAARGFRVIRFDNRDIGLSTKLDHLGMPNVAQLLMAHMAGQPTKAAYTLSDMARDVAGLLDALGIDAAHVVGASMATSGDPSLPPPTPEALQLLMTPTPTDHAGYCRRYVQTMKVLRGPGFPLDEARDLARADRNFRRGLYPPGVARQMVAILASGSRKPALASVRMPTLVIHGDADQLVPVECGIDVADTVPGAQRLVIEGMGHALPITMWPRIIEAIATHAAAASPAR
jgi:pimeloyl-ACP methyl ester carboxylesterase